MPFDALENSLAAGRPVRLFAFIRGTHQWSYSAGDRAVSHLTRSFIPVLGGIQLDGGISQGGDSDGVIIAAPANLEVAQLYRGIPPSSAVTVIIYDRHYGDDDYLVSWVGEVQGVSWPAVDRCRMKCVSESAAQREQAGLRLRWERSCPHCLYERGCYVNRYLHAVSVTVLSMSATTIQVSSAGGHPDGWFTAGYAEWMVEGGNVERRAIDSHVGVALTLFGGTSGVPLGDITLFPGCDQTPVTCNSKFGNMPNYGGFQHIPGRSPFDGNPFF